MSDAIFALRFFQTASLTDAEVALEIAQALVAGRRATTPRKRTVTLLPNGRPTVRAAAGDLLQERGVPMHAKEIAKALRDGGNESSDATVTSALARLAKAENTFRRTAPNTYGLLKWPEEQELLPNGKELPANLQLGGQ